MEKSLPIISSTLAQKIQEANTQFNSAKTLILEAYEIALDDGFTPQEAAKLLYERITIFHEKTIRKWLPSDAKNQNKIRDQFANRGSQKSQETPKNTVNLTTKHEVMDIENQEDDPIYTEFKKDMDKLIEESNPTQTTTERVLQKTGYVIPEDFEEKYREAKIMRERAEGESHRREELLNKAHEENKTLRDEISRLKIKIDEITKTSPLDLPPQAPTVCNTVLKTGTKFQLYLGKEILILFLKQQNITNAREIPNMNIYGEVTKFIEEDDLLIGKIGTLRSAV